MLHRKPIRCLPAGDVVFREGDRGREMFVIKSGRVRLTKTVRGVEKVMTTLPAGEFFGELSLLNHRPRSTTATVVEDTELIEVGPDDFDGIVYHHRTVAARLIRRFAQRLEEANRDLTLLLYRDPPSRVGHALRLYAEQHGHHRDGELVVLLGVAELGTRLGLSRFEMSEVVARFQANGLISTADEEQIVVPDPVKLTRFLEYLESRHEFGAIHSLP